MTPGRVMGQWRLALALCSLVSLPATSTAFDYENALDEDTATYILIGIAAVFFTITLLLLLLIAAMIYYYCIRRKSSCSAKQPPQHDRQSQRDSASKARLPTIPEGSLLPPQPLQPRTDQTRWSKRRLKRLRSDEQELIDNGASNELPSPTDIDTFDIPTAPGNDIESRELDAAQKEEQFLHKIEDAKPANENQRLASTTDGGHTPRLPGAVSPTNETPEMRKKLTPLQPTQPDLKTRQSLAPLKKMPISRKKNQRAVQHSKSPPEAAAAYDYVAESHLAAISRLPNQRLDSPRLQHRKKEILPPIGMTSLTKDASNSPTTTTAENGLTSMFSEIDQELETCLSSKKTPLDTSLVVQNPGFNKVELLILQRQLAPVSQHWYKIGLQLKISKSRLNVIKELHWKSNEKSLHQVCKQWLSIESVPTWDKVVTALRGEGLVHHTQKVAEEIHSRFCQDTSSRGTPDKSTNSEKSLTML